MAKGEKKGGKKKWLIIILVLLVLGAIGNLTGNKDSSTSKTSKSSTTTSTKASTTTNAPTAAPTKSTEPAKEEAAPAEDNSASTEVVAVTDAPTEAPTEVPAKDWLAEYASAGTEVVSIPADVLYEYGSSYVGKTVVTAITVKDKTSSSLKANTENNSSYSFSIVAEFEDKSEISSVSEGSSVIVAGVVDEMNSINFLGSGQTVTLKNSHIVTKGITASEIEGNRETAVSNAQAAKAAAEQAAADAIEAEKQSYISSCEKVKYSDVERNPSQYKGKKIQITGKVIQVSEGWFNSVTLRVEESGGNIWYVSYTRADENEPRILEKDKLTFYGECTGVESYTTIVGSKVTIPAMDAKYYK